MDGFTNVLVSGAYGIKEGQSEMFDFCTELAHCGLVPWSVTIDGNPQLYTMLKALWPKVIIQRCLVHVQRQGLSWCRHNPKRVDAQHLRKLFLIVTAIHTHADRGRFIVAWEAWENRYGHCIAQAPERGRVFSDLKRARSMLQKALPYMFHYLDDPAIPRTTNALEGYFGRMKMRYRQHRGLAPKNRENYFRWYFQLCQR